MSSVGYKPKFYDCTIEGIKRINSKNLFILHWKDSKGDGTMPIQVDQPSELILNRMKEIVDGKRDKLYLTRGMRDIDVSYLGNNKWQLFDEFDILNKQKVDTYNNKVFIFKIIIFKVFYYIRDEFSQRGRFDFIISAVFRLANYVQFRQALQRAF